MASTRALRVGPGERPARRVGIAKGGFRDHLRRAVRAAEGARRPPARPLAGAPRESQLTPAPRGRRPLRRPPRRAEAVAKDLKLGDRVRFLGIRRDVPRILAASDLFAMSSLWEGLGLVFLEAMAARLPIVASRVSAVPEVVPHGTAGLLVPPSDPTAMARAFISIAAREDRGRALGEAGRVWVREAIRRRPDGRRDAPWSSRSRGGGVKPTRVPRLCGDLPPIVGVFGREPEDFVVEEELAYAPSGSGAHLYLWIEKRGIPTFEAVRRLAHFLDRPTHAIGLAGLKDSQSVSRQWLSIEGVEAERLRGWTVGGVRVLDAKEHPHKLRLGHAKGNRFLVRLREVAAHPIARVPRRSWSSSAPAASRTPTDPNDSGATAHRWCRGWRSVRGDLEGVRAGHGAAGRRDRAAPPLARYLGRSVGSVQPGARASNATDRIVGIGRRGDDPRERGELRRRGRGRRAAARRPLSRSPRRGRSWGPACSAASAGREPSRTRSSNPGNRPRVVRRPPARPRGARGATPAPDRGLRARAPLRGLRSVAFVFVAFRELRDGSHRGAPGGSPTKRPKRRQRRGSTSRLRSVELTRPPRITIAIGPRSRAPTRPRRARSEGAPSPVTSAVIRIGSNLSLAPRSAVPRFHSAPRARRGARSARRA